MSEPTTGALRPLDGAVHRACVVPGCWCRGPIRSTARTEPGRRGRAAAPSRTIDLAAWRSVGLPVA